VLSLPTIPIEVSKFRNGFLSRYLAKLSVSPLEASGAIWLISGRNPTRASVKLEAQRGDATRLGQPHRYFRQAQSFVERASLRDQKERLTTNEDTRWTLDIKQKFKEN